ncbi:16S rRNA (guanine(527)-N(7))-methyltransferase RsmG [Sphingomonas sp. BT553]|uniref:Ribosomal RNA small subunit methyltransferase G n=2 Tax=Sphingomonas mollis TaxID=2795726 RepID=A0ABS0XQV6_9SPHN|nr:16S rRNA (guanine(527)-N(7))-methyltransferase RsmG [Sphingomonas sp. BT553]MBJ6122427.1 16S rRNA (guanine(527)-N(7))-methyltransferase RsmG [Sphingomonas sp. BT553]
MISFVDMVVTENSRQNLISPATIPAIWDRHVVDSLQLIEMAGGAAGRWLDIGTGGGFPGMVLAIAGCSPIMMVEPRRKRADFLAESIERLSLTDAKIAASKVENIEWTADVITARAVASVEKLLIAAAHCATKTTRWLLPRGTVDASSLPALCARHQLVFHVEQSLTRSDSFILVLEPRA